MRASLEEQPPEEHGLSRRAALAAGAGAVLAAAAPGTAVAKKKKRGKGKRGKGRVVDLTHTFREDFALYPGSPEASREVARSIEEDGFYGQVWTFWEHTATHMDVPAHFVAGGRTSEEIPLDQLIRPLVVIDISDRAARQNDTAVTVDDVKKWERRYGRVPRGAMVAMDSGWAARAGDAEAFLNDLKFPGFSPEATEFLVKRRDIGGLAVDTLSLDPGTATVFDTHLTLLSAGGVGIENVANLGKVPARGATVWMGLIPWREGSGGPARVLATY